MRGVVGIALRHEACAVAGEARDFVLSLHTAGDAQRFAAAWQEYAMLAAEKNEIESYLKKRQFFGKSTGRQIAMLLSSVLATISIGAYIVLHFLRLV